LSTMLGQHEINLLDVRERAQYTHGHITTAINIPVDELAVRAPHELLEDTNTIVYCQFSAACQARGIPSLCSNATEELRRIGITNVHVVRDPLPLLSDAGIPITGAHDEP